jgi:uncharacterized DUF497 family protein
MNFEFDPDKDALNNRQHGVSLAFGARIFSDQSHLVVPSFRPEDGEDRWKIVGVVDGEFYTAVHVWRGDTIRFISVRRSNAGEERLYHSAASRPE